MSLTSYRAAPSRGNPVAPNARTRYLAIGAVLGKASGRGKSSYFSYGLASMVRHGAMNRAPPRKSDSGAAARLRPASGDLLAEARRQIDEPGAEDATAVHEFRKAMKRWRALLRLYEPLLGAEAERLRVEARDLARELTGTGDARSAPDALA